MPALQVELYADAKAGIALDDDSVQDEAFHPDLATCNPEPNFPRQPGFLRRDGFHIAAPRMLVLANLPEMGVSDPSTFNSTTTKHRIWGSGVDPVPPTE